MIRAVVLRVLCMVFVGWAAVWSQALAKRAELPGLHRAQAVADAGLRMRARWEGRELPGVFLLEGVMSAASWQACLGENGVPTCLEGRALAAYFPLVGAEQGRVLAKTWKGAEFLIPVSAGVLSWYAGVGVELLSEDELRVLAVATSAMLGNPIRTGGQHPVAGVERLRRALADRCGDCAPAPGVLETYNNPYMPISVVLAGEVLARGAGLGRDPVAPLGGLVARVRRGEVVPEEVLQKPGLAGLVALEWGRSEREVYVPALLKIAADGPDDADRLAALYALLRIVHGRLDSLAGTWESLPGGEVVVPMLRSLAPLLPN